MSRNPGRTWTAAQVNRALYITEAAAAQQLAKLAAAGFLREEGGRGGTPLFRFDPADPGMAARVAELAAAYDQRRVRVIEYIYSNPSQSVRSFARAFKFTRDETERDDTKPDGTKRDESE